MLNHSLFLSTYYFFPIGCTIPNDVKFLKHVANLPWRMNPKKHHLHKYFFIQMWPCEVLLPCFLKGQKMIFANSNANILQSMRWKFLKFFPTSFEIRVLVKILLLHVSKFIYLFLKFGTCSRNGNFGAFLVNI